LARIGKKILVNFAAGLGQQPEQSGQQEEKRKNREQKVVRELRRLVERVVILDSFPHPEGQYSQWNPHAPF
jgi:hypothetical protein